MTEDIKGRWAALDPKGSKASGDAGFHHSCYWGRGVRAGLRKKKNRRKKEARGAITTTTGFSEVGLAGARNGFQGRATNFTGRERMNSGLKTIRRSRSTFRDHAYDACCIRWGWGPEGCAELSPFWVGRNGAGPEVRGTILKEIIG